jgi:hypothetical protein
VTQRKKTRRLADMSLPPEERRRKRDTRARGKGDSKQMHHGNSPKGQKLRKEWERRARRTGAGE